MHPRLKNHRLPGPPQPVPPFFWFCFVTTQLARQLQTGTHTGGGAVTEKPGSARLEGTPTMDFGLESIRTHM